MELLTVFLVLGRKRKDVAGIKTKSQNMAITTRNLKQMLVFLVIVMVAIMIAITKHQRRKLAIMGAAIIVTTTQNQKSSQIIIKGQINAKNKLLV